MDEMGRRVLDAVNWCAGRGAFPSEKAFGMAVDCSVAGTQFLQYAAIAMLLYFSLKKIVWSFHEKDYHISRTELFFILTPAAVGLMICMLLRFIMITVEDSVPKMLYDRYPVLVVVIPAILLLSLLSILYGVKLFQDMVCWNREKSGRIILEKQISSLLPQGLNIHSYDIGVILGNAVDNSIEACRKLKAKEPEAGAFIRLCSLQKDSLLILKVENSFDGRLVRRRQEEFPITDKADRKSHGIGLANIKSTAEKYQGTMDFKVKDRVFILSVMMKNEKKNQEGEDLL